MRRGQALRVALGILLALPVLAGLVLAGLAWRLAQGPVDAGFLARRMEAQFPGPGRLSIREARLAWEGFRDEAPLVVEVAGVALRDDAGRVIGLLPDGRVALSVRSLLGGVIAPAEVEMTAPQLRLRRDAEGRVALDLPRPPAEGDAPAEAPDATPGILADLMDPAQDRAAHTQLRRIRVQGATISLADEATGREWRLEGVRAEILRAAEGGLSADGEALLRTGGLSVPVHLSGEARPAPLRLSVRLDLPLLLPAEIAELLPDPGPLALLDARLALSARAELDAGGIPQGATLTLSAPEGGSVAGLPFRALDAVLHAAPHRLDLESARLALGPREVSAQGVMLRGDAGWQGRLNLAAERLEAADLADHWPAAAWPETRAAALVAWPRGRVTRAALGLDLSADGRLRDFRLEGGEVQARAEDLLLALDPLGRVAARAAELDAALTRDTVALRRAALVLAPPGGGPPSTVTAEGEARLAEGRWRGALSLALDRVRAADLPDLWPAGLGGGERGWITGNVTAGEVRAGRWRLEAEAPAGLSALRVLSLGGEATLADATIHWLRPIPPVRGVSGTARFGLEEITLATRGGRQEREEGAPGALEVREGTLRFLFPPGAVPRAEMSFALAGPVAEVVSIVRHPRLRLFERRPFPVQVAAGTQEGTLSIALPLLADLRTEQIRLSAQSRIRNGRLTRALLERDLDDLDVALNLDLDGMRLQGTGSFAGSPIRAQVEMDFRAGPPGQVVSRETASGRFDARTLAELGFDAGALLSGPVAIEARSERRRNNQNTVALRGDLAAATLAFPPLRYGKPRGRPGEAQAVLRLSGDTLTSIENIRVDADGLALRGRAVAPRAGRIERVEFADSTLGASRFAGDARAPARPGGPWAVALRGPVLDLRPVFGPSAPAAPDPAAPGDAPPLTLDLRFDQVLLGPDRAVLGLQARGATDRAGVVREAALRARTGGNGGAFELSLTPRGAERHLRGAAEDGGALLRALGIVSTIEGGRMAITGAYADSRPGAALSGVAELDGFAVREAAALGKLLQAMTLYGLVDTLQGGSGLAFTRAVVPFVLTSTEVRLEEARAFSASLGLTARGRVGREGAVLDLEGTIVPAYFLNALLGNLPLVGRLFSPETGGGVFAATFRATGPAEEASIIVNPLAALTPGFLRGLFGLADGGPRR